MQPPLFSRQSTIAVIRMLIMGKHFAVVFQLVRLSHLAIFLASWDVTWMRCVHCGQACASGDTRRPHSGISCGVGDPKTWRLTFESLLCLKRDTVHVFNRKVCVGLNPISLISKRRALHHKMRFHLPAMESIVLFCGLYNSNSRYSTNIDKCWLYSKLLEIIRYS